MLAENAGLYVLCADAVHSEGRSRFVETKQVVACVFAVKHCGFGFFFPSRRLWASCGSSGLPTAVPPGLTRDAPDASQTLSEVPKTDCLSAYTVWFLATWKTNKTIETT